MDRRMRSRSLEVRGISLHLPWDRDDCIYNEPLRTMSSHSWAVVDLGGVNQTQGSLGRNSVDIGSDLSSLRLVGVLERR